MYTTTVHRIQQYNTVQYNTHLQTNSTQNGTHNNYKEEKRKKKQLQGKNWEVQAMPRSLRVIPWHLSGDWRGKL
jgi:hypothetical protein